MANLGPKPWTNPFEKISIFGLFKFLVFRAKKRHFVVLEYRETHFETHYTA